MTRLQNCNILTWVTRRECPYLAWHIACACRALRPTHRCWLILPTTGGFVFHSLQHDGCFVRRLSNQLHIYVIEMLSNLIYCMHCETLGQYGVPNMDLLNLSHSRQYVCFSGL